MTTEVVQIREGRPSDIPFVTNSWLKSFRANGAFSQSVPNDIYYQQHHKILEAIIPRGLLLVLCNPEDPDQIIGWTLIERQPEILILHYIYIKNSLRRNGLMDVICRSIPYATEIPSSPAIALVLCGKPAGVKPAGADSGPLDATANR